MRTPRGSSREAESFGNLGRDGIMTVDQRERRVLQEALVNALGTESTDTLMDYLPPVGWADVATKTDLENLRVATNTDLENLRVATKTDLENLRVATKTDLENLRVATKTDLENLRVATKADLGNLRVGMKAELAALEKRVIVQLHAELRAQFLSLITVMTMLFGAFAAIVKLA
jgi:hypothetical protein